jgi:hypothetical protein
MEGTEQAIRDIEATPSLLERALKLTGLVTRLFGEAGWDLVVVGGSAVEFYTEGAYMSGDIDLCRRTASPIPLRRAQDLMGQLGATGGPRNWKVAGLFVDLLGLLENEASTPCRTIATPCGPISIIPPELAVVERTLPAFYPCPDSEARDVAKKMLAACVTGVTPVNWDEIERLARLPSFNVAKELRALREEVTRELIPEA